MSERKWRCQCGCGVPWPAWLIGIASILLLFYTLNLGAAHAQSLAGKRWAIVVGVGRYGDPSLSDRTLQYSESDAQGVYDALTTKCGIPAKNVHLLKGPDATKRAVERAFSDVGRDTKPGDTVFIYFSGHGSYVPDIDGDEADGDHLDEVLLPYDAVLGNESTYIIDDVFGYLVSRLRADSVAIMLDSCHSGGQGKSVSTPGLSAKGAADSMAKDIFTDPGARPGRALLSACQSGEVAFENGGLGHGVLTYFLLQGMERKQADTDRDGKVTFAELGAFVEENVRTWCLENGLLQTPNYECPSGNSITVVPSSGGIVAVPAPIPPWDLTPLGLDFGVSRSLVLWQTPPPMVSGATQVGLALSLGRADLGVFVSVPSLQNLSSVDTVGFELGFLAVRVRRATLHAVVSGAFTPAHDWSAFSGGTRLAAELTPYVRIGVTIGVEAGFSREPEAWAWAGASLLLEFSVEACFPLGGER